MLFCLIAIFHGLFLYIVFLDHDQVISKVSEKSRALLLIMPRQKTVKPEKPLLHRAKFEKRRDIRYPQLSMKLPTASEVEMDHSEFAETSTKNKIELPLNFDREIKGEILGLLDHERPMSNYKPQNKWQQFSKTIETAGKRRGNVDDTFTLPDGSRITKHNERCYKSPDPGREYLRQPEIREVFCPK